MSTPARLCLISLLACSLPAAGRADEPARDDAPAAFRQLGKLCAGLAFTAREKERSPLKAAHLYLQAARAFQRAGDDEYRKALAAGVVASRPLRATWVHSRRAVAALFLPGDKQVLTCGADGDVHVWDAATGRQVKSFQAEDAQTPDGKLAGAALSRDGSRLLLWGYYTVQLWDLDGGKRLHTWKLDPQTYGAAFLQDDRRILFWSDRGPAQLWDVETLKEVAKLNKGVIDWRSPIAVSPDRTRLLTADGENAYLWDAASGELRRTLPAKAPKDGRASVAFTPDGKGVLLAGLADGSARLVDAGTGRTLGSFGGERPGRRPWMAGATASRDGNRVLTWDEYGKARLFDAGDASLLHTFQGLGDEGARFSPDGKRVLTLGRQSVLWDAADGQPDFTLGPADDAAFIRDGSQVLLWGHRRAELWQIHGQQLLRAFGGEEDVAAGVAFSADESLLLVRSREGAVRLWDLRRNDGARTAPEDDPRAVQTFRCRGPVLSATLDRDERRLLTCDAGGSAQLWDVSKGERLQSFAHGEGVRGAAFDPEGKRVLTWGEGGAVKLWDALTGKETRSLKHPADVRGAAFGPEGEHVLTWDADYTARWWDLSRDEPLHAFEHSRDLLGARLDSRGERALTWGLDRAARVWDLGSGRLVRELTHDGPVFGAAFAAEEGRVWAWAGDGLREWDVKAGKELRLLRVKGGVPAAELSRDGRRFLIRDAEGLIQHLDAASGKALASFAHVFNVYGYYESVTAGAFSPDQTRALTWAGDGSVNLWDLASGLKLQTFRQAKAVRGAAFTRDGKGVLTWGADGEARLWAADFPALLGPDDQRLELEVRSGLRLDEHGVLKNLTPEEWRERGKRLDAVLRKGEDR